jgi:hypothetical protein
LALVGSSLANSPSHDDLLFIALLFDGFYGLLRLGELVWPDNPALQTYNKITQHTLVVLAQSHHSFILWSHKSDHQFEGSTILFQKAEVVDPHHAFLSYLASQDRLFPLHSFLWLRSDGSVPTHVWFIKHLQHFFPDSISGHSLCTGGATSLAATGVPADRIQAMGHWSSDAFQFYICKNPALLHTLVFNGQSIHDSAHPFGSI